MSTITAVKRHRPAEPAKDLDPHAIQAAYLADPLVELGQVGEKSEQAAGVLLLAIAKAEIRTLRDFDAAIKIAYDQNGWHVTAGRPAKEDQERRAVPHTVRTYVWEIRSAYRAGIEVWAMASMYDLRMSKRKLKDEAEDKVASILPAEFAGVRLTAQNRYTGSVFHDVCVTGALLPKRKRGDYMDALARVMAKYQRLLPAKLRPESQD